MVVVIKLENKIEIPKIESNGAAIAIASCSPENKIERMGDAYTAIPIDAGIDSRTVHRTARSERLACKNRSLLSIAPASCGTKTNEIGVISASSDILYLSELEIYGEPRS